MKFTIHRSIALLGLLAGLSAPLAAAPQRDPSARAAADAKAAYGAKIELNTASLNELEALPGVGPQTAKAIAAARPFASIDDLERVSGIGAAKLEALRDHVTVRPRRSAAMETKRGGSIEVPTSTPSRRAVKAPVEVQPPRSTGSAAEQKKAARQDEDLAPTGRPSAGRADSGASGAKVNLNTATREELEALPEIGPVKAQAIIDARPFRSIEEVKRVSGIKEGTFEVIRDRITVR